MTQSEMDYMNVGSSFAPDWDNKVLITKSTSSVSDLTYNVPADGFITGTGYTTSGNAIITIQINRNGSTKASTSVQNGSNLNTSIPCFPVSMGDEAHVWCILTASNGGIYFVPWKRN